MKDDYYYTTNLLKKIENPDEIDTKEVLCFWSDLLGFGNIFFEKDWNLTKSDQKEIYTRLNTAHSEFLRQTSPIGEKSLVLNDGLVKVGLIDELKHPDIIGIFLRGCVWTHMNINRKEQENDLPGCRSILSFGETIKYIEEEMKLDDYVANYTKPNPNEISTTARKSGNPTIVYNPSPFQMNTAFSKSYILDSLGSKYGISGNKFFIDQSVIDFSKNLAKNLSFDFKEDYNEDSGQFIVLKSEHFPSFGFELDKIIPIDYKGWKTKIYRVKSFYPHDEDMREFKMEL